MEAPKKFKAPHLSTGTKKFARKRLYDTVDWALYRVKFISANPKCYCCGERSRVVDHFISHRKNEELFWKEDNFVPMCMSCHGIVSNKFERKDVQDVEGKLAWVNQKRLETGTSVRVKIVSLT